MSKYVTYKWERYDKDYHIMSVGNQPLIVCKEYSFIYYIVSCVYPSPEFYEREIRYFLKCTFPSLTFEDVLEMAKTDKRYTAKHYI